MSEPFDIVALAEAINLRREELERQERKVLITPAMSRLLEHSPSYMPYRERKAARKLRTALNPAIGTVVEIAAALDTTVGSLLGERAYRITRADRERVREFVRYLVVLFQLV